MINNLIALTSIGCPSGNERSISQHLLNEFKGINYNCHIDILGNVIIEKRGRKRSSIMLLAHMDEVGFMVTYIDERGFVFFDKVGGIASEILPGIKVTIHHSQTEVLGVVGVPVWNCEQKMDSSYGKLWIDIGARNREEALKFISIGDYISFTPSFIQLKDDLISSKSLDNRVGTYIIKQVMKALESEETEDSIYAVFSTKEEIGCIGSVSAANGINPKECVVVDMTHSTDYPTSEPTRRGDLRLNQGVAIGLGADISSEMHRSFTDLAQRNRIDYQIEPIPSNSYTEANRIQNVKTGIQTLVISIPCRYMHSPQEVCGIRDISGAIRLLTLYCRKQDQL